MNTESFDNRKWDELGASIKTKLIISCSLVASSIILGFISFVMLLEIPTSVIYLDGLWLSTATGVLGISSYFHTKMVQFQTEVKTRFKELDTKTSEEA